MSLRVAPHRLFARLVGIAAFVLLRLDLLPTPDEMMQDRQIQAIRAAYNEGIIDRDQTRRMLGEQVDLVDRWSAPDDP